MSPARRLHVATTIALLFVWAPAGCGGREAAAPGKPEVAAPRGPEPGRRLPWPEATEPVRDWSFASAEEEIVVETTGPRGAHSVTVWCVVRDGRLYVATDSSVRRKRWVQDLEREPDARVGIRDKTYGVRARAVGEAGEWDAVMNAFASKYGQSIGKYDFPRAGDMSRGRVFELQRRS